MLGMISIAKDLNVDLLGALHSDSSAAIGIIHRRGLGKIKHMHTQYLWVQERLKAGDFTVHKVGTDNNPADLFTKYLARQKIDKFCERLIYLDASEANDLELKINTVVRTRKMERRFSKIRQMHDHENLEKVIASLERMAGMSSRHALRKATQVCLGDTQQ